MSSNATASSEFRVNTYTAGDQTGVSSASMSDGGWVVTWESYGQDGDGDGVYAQRYHADGTKNGDEIAVNSYATSNQREADVIGLSDGSFLVTWQSYGQDSDGEGVYQRRFDADGAPTGSEVQVNDTYINDQSDVTVTALTGGGWVVCGQSENSMDNDIDIYLQRYGSDGERLDSPARVNTTVADYQTNPSITALVDGGWVVTWQSSESSVNIYQRRYASDGSTSGADILVNSPTGKDSVNTSVTALLDGGWVVTWQATDLDGDGSGIFQQHYASDGSSSGIETLVNTTTVAEQTDPSVTLLADGGWVVTWMSSTDVHGDGLGIFQQRYAADGTAAGGETLVNVSVEGDPANPNVTALTDGGWVVSWTATGLDGDEDGIYSRHFAADIVGTTGAESLTGTSWDENIYGNDGADVIDGVAGADRLYGGAGDDTYVIGNAQTRIAEDADAGTDTVVASVSFRLGANVENLRLDGDEAIDGTGNAANNTIIGNSAANILAGGGGGDTLNGLRGADTMSGGKGNDTYVVDESGDRVAEKASSGIDLVRSAVSFRLGANVENLTLISIDLRVAHASAHPVASTGPLAIDGTGNALANILLGNSAANRLDGMAGSDRLTGGAGADTFIFDTRPGHGNVDRITDFSHSEDTFEIDSAVFRGLHRGELSAGAFNPILGAHDSVGVDADTRILYDRTNSDLYFDRDGSGDKYDRVLFAHLKDGTVLSHSDFEVI
jgi:Ca2+-binding RTX toxin-like protein